MLGKVLKNRKNKIVHDLHTKQRFVISIKNIEKAVRVFKYLGRPGRLWQF
jgi:hypothetical protein